MPEDRRAVNARLTEAGWEVVVAAAPGHVDAVREHVIDALSADQLDQLAEIAAAILGKVDADMLDEVARVTVPARPPRRR